MAAKKMPWYKWYPIDWRLSESRADMDLAERGLYRDLLDIHYSDGSIPADPVVLAKMLSIEQSDFDKAWVKVSQRFCTHRTNPLRLVNKRAVKVSQEIATYREAQAEIARIAANDRAKKKKQKELNPQGSLRVASGSSQGPLRVEAANPQPSESESESESESDKNKISEPKGSSPPKAAPSWGSEFDSWWSIWPRKTAKGDALKAYRQVVVSGNAPGLPKGSTDKFAERHERLMEVTPLWVDREFAERDSATIPYPATFLRRLDWLEPPEQRSANQPLSPLARAAARLIEEESHAN